MRFLCVPLLLLAASAMGTPADTTYTAGDKPPTVLPDTIIVTADRLGLPLSHSVWPAGIVQVDKLTERSSLTDLLDGRMGIDTRQSTGFGSVSTMSSWGSFARHMLLAYDGRVVRDYSLGGFNIAEYGIDEFERIEMVKGPQSTWYGSDALGGVINLISRNSLVDRLDFTARAGSFNLQQYRADVSRAFGLAGVGGFVEWAESDNARANSGTQRWTAGMRGDFLSRDGHHRGSLSARYFTDSLGVPGPVPSEGYVPPYGSLESSSLFDHQTDESYSLDVRYKYDSPSLGEFGLDAFWEKKHLFYYSLYNYQYDYDAGGTTARDSVDVRSDFLYDKRSAGLSVHWAKEVRRYSFSGGVDWLNGNLGATSKDSSFATNISGPGAPYSYTFSSFNYWRNGQDQTDLWGGFGGSPISVVRFDLGGRLQFVAGRRTQPSYSLGAVLFPDRQYSLRLAYGYAFRLPSVAEQFAEEFYTAGNRNLESETARTLAVTFAWHDIHNRVQIEGTVFRQRTANLIRYLPDPITFRYVPTNFDQFRCDGVDLSLSADLFSKVSTRFSGVFQSAEQTTESGNYVGAFYVPDIKWYGELVYAPTAAVRLSSCLRYTSERSIVMFGGAEKVIPKVYELGLSGQFDLTQKLSLGLSAWDLTDEGRADQFGYTMQDRDYPSLGRRVVAEIRASLF